MNKSAKEMFEELGQILQFINNDVLTKGKTTQEDLLQIKGKIENLYEKMFIVTEKEMIIELKKKGKTLKEIARHYLIPIAIFEKYKGELGG